MATFKAQVESLVGTITDTSGLDVWLTEAAKMLSNLIPETELHRYASATTTTTYTLSLASKRALTVRKGSWPAQRVSPDMEGKVTDTNSLHYATAYSPVFLIAGETLYAYPAATPEATVLVYTYPTVLYTDSAVALFPDELEPAIVRWAAKAALISRIAAYLKTTLDSLTWTIASVPSAPAAASFSFTSILGGDITVTTIGAFPAAPTISAPTLDLTTPYSELDTALDTEEDVEQAQAKINEIQARISEYQADLQVAVASFQASLQTWSEEVKKDFEEARLAQEAIITDAKMDNDVETTNNIKVLEADIAEYQSNLAKYQAEVQAYAAEATAEAHYHSSMISKIQAEVAGNKLAADMLQAEFDATIQMYLKTIGAQK